MRSQKGSEKPESGQYHDRRPPLQRNSSCGRYTTKTLSCYIDKALLPNLMGEVETHIKGCAQCRKTVEAYQRIDANVLLHIDALLSLEKRAQETERIMTAIRHEKKSAWSEKRQVSTQRFTFEWIKNLVFNFKSPWTPNAPRFKISLQLASLAAIILISVTVMKTIFSLPPNRTPAMMPSNDNPSAIVTSVDGDVASVMILETKERRHTIIWYQEA